MEQIELQASKRETIGKKARFLRREGIIPTHLYGRGIESVALQCDISQLQQVLTQAGKTRLINLKLDKAKKPRNVVIREIQRSPLTGALLHVDFYEVSMSEKIKVEVPIVLVGESPALKFKENMLLHETSSVSVECLPDRIPASIELELSILKEAEDSIHIKDIKLGEGITILNDPERIVVKVSVRRVEKIEEKVKEEVEAPEAVSVPEEEKGLESTED